MNVTNSVFACFIGSFFLPSFTVLFVVVVHSLLCIVNVGKVTTTLLRQPCPWSFPREPAFTASSEEESHTPELAWPQGVHQREHKGGHRG